ATEIVPQMPPRLCILVPLAVALMLRRLPRPRLVRLPFLSSERRTAWPGRAAKIAARWSRRQARAAVHAGMGGWIGWRPAAEQRGPHGSRRESQGFAHYGERKRAPLPQITHPVFGFALNATGRPEIAAQSIL